MNADEEEAVSALVAMAVPCTVCLMAIISHKPQDLAFCQRFTLMDGVNDEAFRCGICHIVSDLYTMYRHVGGHLPLLTVNEDENLGSYRVQRGEVLYRDGFPIKVQLVIEQADGTFTCGVCFETDSLLSNMVDHIKLHFRYANLIGIEGGLYHIGGVDVPTSSTAVADVTSEWVANNPGALLRVIKATEDKLDEQLRRLLGASIMLTFGPTGANLPTWDDEMTRPRLENSIWYCALCMYKSKWEAFVLAHMNFAHNEPRRPYCPKCAKGFTEPNEVQAHLEEPHPKVELYQCLICSEVFTNLGDWRGHVMRLSGCH